MIFVKDVHFRTVLDFHVKSNSTHSNVEIEYVCKYMFVHSLIGRKEETLTQ